MKVIEFRIPLPMSLEEFQVGQLYTVGELSLENTNEDTAAVVLANEPFENERGKGQYTHKVFNLGSKAPGYLRSVIPTKAFELHEKAWNCFPFCRTEYTLPFVGTSFSCVVESIHLPDRGETFNAHGLSDELLKQRQVKFVDIRVDDGSQTPASVVAEFASQRSGRGPLANDWIQTVEPVMCCYKLTTIKCSIPFFSGKVESTVESQQVELLLEFAKQCFLRIDKWYGMTMDDIREFEARVKEQLDLMKMARGSDSQSNVSSVSQSNISSSSMASSSAKQ